MPHYIEKRRRLWYFVIAVPAELRKTIGKVRIVQSLKTDSERLARREASQLAAQWLNRFDELRGKKTVRALVSPVGGSLGLGADIRSWVEAASSEEERDEREQIAREEMGRIGDPVAYRVVIAEAPVLTHSEAYLATRDIMEKTKDEYRMAFRLLAHHHPDAAKLTRREAADFVEKVLKAGVSLPTQFGRAEQRPRSPEAVNKLVGAYSGLWKYLRNKGHIPEDRDPWSNQRLARGKQKASDKRRVFTDDEANRYLAAVRDKLGTESPFTLIVETMALTGMRSDEVAQLKAGDVVVNGSAVWLTVREGKTAAASRRIPIVHDEVCAKLAAKLSSKAADDDMFSEIRLTRFGDRSDAVTKKLSPILRKVVDDPAVVPAHTWRHYVRTKFEQAEIHGSAVDYFIGHARQGTGFRVYAKGPSDEKLISMARMLKLP